MKDKLFSELDLVYDNFIIESTFISTPNPVYSECLFID